MDPAMSGAAPGRAESLAERLGFAAGDRVAIAMRNYPEWLLIYWGCVASGVTVVGMNAWWTSEEMAYALADSAPKVLFLDAERLERVHARPDMAAGMTLVGVRIPGSPAGVIPSATALAASRAPARALDRASRFPKPTLPPP